MRGVVKQPPTPERRLGGTAHRQAEYACGGPADAEPTFGGAPAIPLAYGPGVDGTNAHDPVSVITLNRLGLIEPAYIKFKTFEPGGHDDRYGEYGPTQDEISFPGDLSSVVITPLGYAFGRAVGLTISGATSSPSQPKI